MGGRSKIACSLFARTEFQGILEPYGLGKSASERSNPMIRLSGLLGLAWLIGITATHAQQAGMPEKKYEFPTEINGKKREQWVKDMRSPDPSVREEAIRLLPAFGPEVRKLASQNLLHALTLDPDYSVRLAALQMIPVVGLESQGEVDAALRAIVDLFRSNQLHTRFEAMNALAQCGSMAKGAIPSIVDTALKDRTNWQMRKASCLALSKIAFDEKNGPETKAVNGLIATMLTDPSIEVRRESIQALLTLGLPASATDYKNVREALARVITEKSPGGRDKQLNIWARVAFLRLETERVPRDHPVLMGLDKYFKDVDDDVRMDVIKSIGTLGSEGASRLDLLMEVVNDPKENDGCKGLALWSMSKITSQSSEVIPFLLKVAKETKNKDLKEVAESLHKEMTNPNKKDEPKKEEPKKEEPKKDKTTPKK
jgi:HEAT repeat protein